MPFNTLSYFLFLPVVFLLHYFTPDRFRWLVLLVASFLFYAALKAPHLIAVLILVTTITYFTGIWIDRNENTRTKRYLLWGGISVNVLTLVILKYLPFITQNLNILLNLISLGTAHPVSKIIIAIGASYFIFQAISYLIDVYLEVEKAECHFGHFALYLSFFPKLLQGPIERGGELLPQFKMPYVFNYANLRSGALLFMLGLFKKLVIADRLAIFVDAVYKDVHVYSGLSLLLATYAFAFQIYMDFSGYTDMALGSARLFNINLTQNFNSPYLATSIADFWRRWHITFSRWILDYIFRPLQMQWRNWKSLGTATALLVTFIISGIWHGASWGFVIWGGLHGLYMACSIFYKPYQKKLHNALGVEKSKILKVWQVFITFNLVSFAWIFFRANTISDAYYVIKYSLWPIIFSFEDISLIIKMPTVDYSQYDYLILLISTSILLSYNYIYNLKLSKYPLVIRWLMYYVIIYFILFAGIFKHATFIY